MKGLGRYLRDDAGAVTTDWVVLTASFLLLGMAVVYTIFNTGVEGVVADTNSALSDVTFITVGAAPSF